MHQKSLQNLTLCSCYFLTFVSTSRPRSLCHLAHSSWCDILWCTLDMTAHEWPTGMRDSSCPFPARLSRITPLSAFKKLENQTSNRKILRKEVHLLCSPRGKQELGPAFQMPHPILHTDIYSYNANMRNARALILTDTRAHMFFNTENLKSLWRSGRKHLATPNTKPVTGLFVNSLFFHRTHREAQTKPIAEKSVKQSL